MDEKRPHLSSFKDRHGTERWRFRKGGKTVSLKGRPGEAQFEADYEALLEGRKLQKSAVIPMPGRAIPQSFNDGWKRVLKSAEWQRYSQATKSKNVFLAEEFLNLRIIPEEPAVWGDMPVDAFRRRHMKDILARFADTPHKAKHLLTTIRKIIAVALDEEWIEIDPTHQIKWRPAYTGWRAWTAEEMAAFVKRWPVGTTPHLIFSIALWLGNRRGDISTLKWSDRQTRAVMMAGERRIVRGFEIEQEKGGKKLFVPEAPPLTAALEATKRDGDMIVLTAYGKPFSEKSLTGRMADWTELAYLPKGCTLHGLRKTLGKRMAEAGVTTRQAMVILGHDDIAHAELYSREADSVVLAIDAMDKVVKLFGDG